MNLMAQRKNWRSAAGLICMVMLVASCTNLAAVREWSKTSLDATEFNQIITTYYKTPERLKQYDPEGPWDELAAMRENQAKALKEILSIVTDYMAALSTLSAESTIDYKKDVDALTKGIGKLDAGISKETLGAVGSVVNAVLGAVTKVYQAKQVTELVTQANDSLQVILKGEIREIVHQDFRNDLKNEAIFLGRYYKELLQKDSLSHDVTEELKQLIQRSDISTQAKDKLTQLVETGSTSRAARTALKEWKDLRLQENAVRLKALDAYLVVLDKVAEGHQKLYESRNDLDAKALIKDLYSLVVELRKQIRILAES